MVTLIMSRNPGSCRKGTPSVGVRDGMRKGVSRKLRERRNEDLVKVCR